ncbi:MAG: aldo/keto reductase [Planctomycetaceae bacterium]
MTQSPLSRRPLGKTGITLPVIGYGSMKIGRNQGIKYPNAYDLPSDAECERLLNAILDLGMTYIDTAPAYGLSEERIGRAVAHRRKEFLLSTKVGENFENGVSSFDYSDAGVRASIERSLRRLQTDVLDLVFIHSNGDDVHIMNDTAVVAVLQDFKHRGVIRAIGMSGKTVEGARQALDWADAIMVEYNLQNPAHAEVMHEAHDRGVGVVVKKGLGSGHLPAGEAIRFVLDHSPVTSVVIGGLNVEHLQENLQHAR